MIEKIKIRNVASYGDSGSELHDLKKINFVFGSNGTGKTTISRIIDNATEYPYCGVVWKNGTQLDTLVYNSDFVERNLNQPDELEGIFTLGEKDKEVFDKISTAKGELDEINASIADRKIALEGDMGNGGKQQELKDLNSEFTDKCWELKADYEPQFIEAFTGLRGSKETFSNELLRKSECLTGASDVLSDLETKAETVFGSEPQQQQKLEIPIWDALLAHETDQILSKRVIGKSDVDIAAMIVKLNNSDWVKQGIKYYDTQERICPFCQQATDVSLELSLNEYFDESFEKDTTSIKRLCDSYKTDANQLTVNLREILGTPSTGLEFKRLQHLSKLLDAVITTNLQRIAGKLGEPSKPVELESLDDIRIEVIEMLENANDQIREHNEMVRNINVEKRELTKRIWQHLIKEVKKDLADYRRKKNNLEKEREGLQQQIDYKNIEKRKKEEEIRNFEKETTSIEPTIDRINSFLNSFGFRGFFLAKSKRESFYEIHRPDGTDAKKTLSEGEKSFVAFLYFYHLLKGSKLESGMTVDRVVVLDDPVSSFDSEILFIVSQMIKELIENTKDQSESVKQVFVLTHNVYFHREVSYKFRRKPDNTLKDETFWIVRKRSEDSEITGYPYNPIQTGYQLMWDELRNIDLNDGANSSTVQNLLRRILENYFTIMGGKNRDDIYGKFEGHEKITCKSLFSWTNAGSHAAYDSLYIQDDESEKFIRVFRNIFKKMGHFAHYEMMMGEESTSSEEM